MKQCNKVNTKGKKHAPVYYTGIAKWPSTNCICGAYSICLCHKPEPVEAAKK